MALSGQPAPGTPPGVEYDRFTGFDGPGVINNNGEVAFRAILSGVSSGNGEANFVESGTALDGYEVRLAALSGQPATDSSGSPIDPVTPGNVTLMSVQPPYLNGDGNLAFYATLAGAGVTTDSNETIYQFEVDPVDPVFDQLLLSAREGGSNPTGGGVFLQVTNDFRFSEPTTDPLFHRAVVGDPGAPESTDGMFDTASFLALEGQAVPGIPGDVRYSSFPTSGALNPSNDNAFIAKLMGDDVDSLDENAVLRSQIGDPGAADLIARSDMPGQTQGGIDFVDFTTGSLTMNNQRTLALLARLDNSGGMGPAALPCVAMFPAVPTPIVARFDDPAPGLGGDVRYGQFLNPVLAGNGDLAFLAGLTGPGVTSSNNIALFLINNSGVDSIAREGDPAPGFQAGTTYLGLTRDPVMNSQGIGIFHATVLQPGSFAGEDAIYRWGTSGTPHLLIGAGDTVEVGPGDVRTVTEIDIVDRGSGQDGRRVSMNDLGLVAVRLTMSGEFGAVSSMIAVLDDIFADGFESGDTSAWSSTVP